MAFNYDTGGSGLFDHLGDLLKAFNIEATTGRLIQQFTTLDSLADTIVTGFEVGSLSEHIEGLLDDVKDLKNSYSGLRLRLLQYMINRLQDRTTVIEELDLADISLNTILDALIEQMDEDSESIDASTVTIGGLTSGSATADADNLGSEYAWLVDKTLDAVSQPGVGKRTHYLLDGVDSEFGEDQTCTIECLTDSFAGQVTAGEETFSLVGEAPGVGGVLYDPVGGSGRGPSLNTINQQTKLLNGTFESWAVTDTPDNWTVDAGVVTTNISQETTQVYRGSSALEFTGDASAATIQLSQALTISDLVPGKRYIVGVRYKASAIDTATQHILIQFTGTGYTPASSEKIDITGDNWATSWTLATFYINLPRNLPSDWTLTIAGTGTWNSGKMVWFDDLVFAPVTWFAGINVAGFAGSTPAVKGDRFTFNTTNDGAGKFSRLFTRHFGVQLISNNAGAETIDDALAE